MITARHIAAALGTSAIIVPIVAVAVAREQYPGQYTEYTPEQRDWFKSVRSPSGVPCCNIADGHLTDWTQSPNGQYIVPINGNQVPVPPEAVVHTANPMEKAIVWYVAVGNDIHIRCFVPSSEV